MSASAERERKGIMSSSKHLLEMQERKSAIGTEIAIQSGVLERCDYHSDAISVTGRNSDSAYRLGNAQFTAGGFSQVFGDRREMTDYRKQAIEDAGLECAHCAKHERRLVHLSRASSAL